MHSSGFDTWHLVVLATAPLFGCRPTPSAGPDPAPPTSTGAPEASDAPPETPPPQATPEEATSLLGAPLLRPVLPDDVYADRYAKWRDAWLAHDATPDDLDALVWLGRRTAYLGKYREAFEIYDRGLLEHPDEPHLLRHRGHRHITTRDFEAAVRDLTTAAKLADAMPSEVEEDGLPNPAGIPTGTLQTNVHYHLGLAHFLLGDFDAAREAYVACEKAATTDDMRVAVTHWRYMTERRLGNHDAAKALLEPFRADMKIHENFAYLRLLMLYKGELAPGDVLGEEPSDLDRATMGFGLGNWSAAEGDDEAAIREWKAVIATEHWAAFGYIAAEAELARRSSTPD